jgi:hypothetical protein
VIAFIEVNTVKFRLLSVPNLAALSFIVALLGFLQYFIFWRLEMSDYLNVLSILILLSLFCTYG